MVKQINSVVKNRFYQLRLISKVKSALSFKDLETVIHAFITSRLDYCNSLYDGLPQSSIARLQMVQNAAARILSSTRKFDHITPVLASLHWLPVQFRIRFKMLLFVFKALNGQAPSYISDLLKLHTPIRSLRSADKLLLYTPRSRCIHTSDRAFSVVGPKLWIQLPLSIRQTPSLSIFKSKTHLYVLAFPTT